MDKKLHDQGLENRKEVLGADYVERSMSQVDDFNRELQEVLNEYCWGKIWSGKGLDRKQSILNLGMLAALGRSHEFKLHFRGALNNGVSVEELKDVLLQITGYCGFPAGVESFRLAKEVLNEQKENEHTNPGKLETFGFVGLGSMGAPWQQTCQSLSTNYVSLISQERKKELLKTLCAVIPWKKLLRPAIPCFESSDGGDVIQTVLELSNMKQTSCKTVIDTSTIGIDAVNQVQQVLDKSGITYLDCPVSGGQSGAKARTLTFMVSGPENRFRELENILKSMSSNIFYLGKNAAEAGDETLNNFLSGTAMLATSEAYAFGINQGLDPEQMFKVLNVSTGVNSATLDKFPKQVASQQYAAGFSNTMMSKDVTLFRESVKKTKTLTTLGEMVRISGNVFPGRNLIVISQKSFPLSRNKT